VDPDRLEVLAAARERQAQMVEDQHEVLTDSSFAAIN
jgi:hypothetical protein